MKAIKLLKVMGCDTSSPITHNEINADLMPDVEKYWANRGSFNYKIYDQLMRIRNTEVIRTEKNKPLEAVYIPSSDLIELRQGVGCYGVANSDPKAPIVLSVSDLDKVYETVFNLKEKQL
jgi:hypothetical protein